MKQNTIASSTCKPLFAFNVCKRKFTCAVCMSTMFYALFLCVFFSNLANGMQIQLKQLFSMVFEYGFAMHLNVYGSILFDLLRNLKLIRKMPLNNYGERE